MARIKAREEELERLKAEEERMMAEVALAKKRIEEAKKEEIKKEDEVVLAKAAQLKELVEKEKAEKAKAAVSTQSAKDDAVVVLTALADPPAEVASDVKQ